MCVRACVRACVSECVRACVRACVCASVNACLQIHAYSQHHKSQIIDYGLVEIKITNVTVHCCMGNHISNTI